MIHWTFYSTTGNVCASLTSSVTIGFVLGLFKGRIFSKLNSVSEKIRFIKRNYLLAFLSTLGLALCATPKLAELLGNPTLLAAFATLFAGLVASAIAFPFYQLPTIVSSAIFPNSSAVSLSLLEATAFFSTAPILTANSAILGRYGWTASWTFMAIIFGMGGTLMMSAMPSVLTKAQQETDP